MPHQFQKTEKKTEKVTTTNFHFSSYKHFVQWKFIGVCIFHGSDTFLSEKRSIVEVLLYVYNSSHVFFSIKK